MNVEISFGAMSPPLAQQLQRQGLAVRDNNQLEHLQLDVDALTRLVIRDVLTDSAATAVRKKLLKRVCALKMTHSTPTEPHGITAG